MTKILQFRIYVYTILFTYGYVQYVSDQNGYHTHKRTNCNIMYQHSDVTRLRCTLFNKKKLILEKRPALKKNISIVFHHAANVHLFFFILSGTTNGLCIHVCCRLYSLMYENYSLKIYRFFRTFSP